MNRLVLDRWLIGGVLRATFLVAAALAGLLLFFDLLDALDRLGKPGWSVGRILAYTALLQPGRWLEMAPVALLVGTLVALANWARHRELAVLLGRIKGKAAVSGYRCDLMDALYKG